MPGERDPKATTSTTRTASGTPTPTPTPTPAPAAAAAPASAPPPRINWNDASMHSSYANVCNVSFTRDEVTLIFGMNKMWQSGQTEVTVDLTERVILSPFAAKRLSKFLADAVASYETRYGKLPDAG